eukprot:g37.t1
MKSLATQFKPSLIAPRNASGSNQNSSTAEVAQWSDQSIAAETTNTKWNAFAVSSASKSDSSLLSIDIYLYGMLSHALGIEDGRAVLAFKHVGMSTSSSTLVVDTDGTVKRVAVNLLSNRSLTLAIVLASLMATCLALATTGALRYEVKRRLNKWISWQINEAHSRILAGNIREQDEALGASMNGANPISHGTSSSSDDSGGLSDILPEGTETERAQRENTALIKLSTGTANSLFMDAGNEDLSKAIGDYDINDVADPVEGDKILEQLTMRKQSLHKLEQMPSRTSAMQKAIKTNLSLISNKYVQKSVLVVVGLSLGIGLLVSGSGGLYPEQDPGAGAPRTSSALSIFQVALGGCILVVTFAACTMVCKRALKDQGLCLCVRSASDVRSMGEDAGGVAQSKNACAKRDEDQDQIIRLLTPSPFEIPELVFRFLWGRRHDSLTEFLRGPTCFLENESNRWDGGGRDGALGETTVTQFVSLYRDWCDHEDKQQLRVLKRTDILSKCGISVNSRLENVVKGVRRASRSEKESFDRDPRNQNLYSELFSKLRTWYKYIPCKECAGEKGSFSCEACHGEGHLGLQTGNINSRTRRIIRRASFAAYKALMYESGHFVVTGRDFDAVSFSDLGIIAENWHTTMKNKFRTSTIKRMARKGTDTATQKDQNVVKGANFFRRCCRLRSASYYSSSVHPGEEEHREGDEALDIVDVLDEGASSASTRVAHNKDGVSEEEIHNAIYEMLCNPQTYKPIHVILDDTPSALGGLQCLCRKEMYTLRGVEVLSKREFRALRSMTVEGTGLGALFQKNMSRAQYACSALGYVLIASMVAFLVPLPLAILAFWMQDTLKATTAVRSPLVIEDLVFKPFDSSVFRSKRVPVEAAIFLVTMILYYMLSFVKLMMFFTVTDNTSKKRRTVRFCFLAATTVYIFLGLLIVYNALLWIILGAVLNPVSILPYSVAIAGAATFVTTKTRSAMRMRRNIRQKMEKQIRGKLGVLVSESNLHNKVRAQAAVKKERSRQVELRARRGTSKKSESGAENDYQKDASLSTLVNTQIGIPAMLRRMTPTEVFRVYDTDGNQQLSSREYLRILEELKISVAERKALRLFARHDKGGMGCLTLEEFKSCWQSISAQIARDAMSNIGVTEGMVAQGVFVSAMALSLLFCFVFFSVSAFGGQGAFGSGIRGMMAAAAARLGGGANKMRAPDNIKQEKAVTDALAVLTGAVEDNNGEDADS